MAYLRIVTGGHQGNWPTIGCQGILQVLAALPMFAATDGLVGYCIDTLARQVDEQVLPDGVQDELTPHYHTVVINNLLTAIECLQRLEGQLRPETTVTLEAMVRYQQQTVVPDGSAQVAFNDSDPAAVPKVAARLQRLGLSHYLRPAADLGSEVYPYAGVAFLRQPATEGDLYLAFDGGPFGRAHQHEDMLAFWLHAYGRNHLVDPGRHLYDSSDASYRGYLSSTQAHSTITIDGCGQHARGRPENWIASEPTGLGLVVTATQVRAAATYDLGYGPDNDIEVAHHRQIVFAEQRFWIIVDTVSAAAVDGRHRIESRFQFGPGDLRLDDDGRARTTHDDANLLLWTSAGWDAQQVLTGSETPGGGWYSPSYGRLEPAPCLCLERSAQLPFRSATLLYPYRGATPPAVDFAWADGVATVSSAEVGKVRIEAEPSGEPL
jgi:hypothetical protein